MPILLIFILGWLLIPTANATSNPDLAADSGPRVITSIAPIQSLVAGVMGGSGPVEVLVNPGASPHTYRLRPSQIEAVHRAGLIVVVGVSELEGFLTPVLEDMADGPSLLRLVDIQGMRLLKDRVGGVRVADETARREGTIDGHLWLNPRNAALIVGAVATRLARLDAANAKRYLANAHALQARIEDLDRAVQERVAPVHGRPAIVLHDAYQYLEDRYDLNVVATVSVDPGHPPGARRLHQIRKLIDSGRAVCLFSEPEYPNRLLASLLRGGVRHASLDPLGSTVELGPELYFSVMRQLARQIADCLRSDSVARSVE